MFFCYERNNVDRHWQPAVYYDDVPALNSSGREAAPERSEIKRVPPHCINMADGEPNFRLLREEFPLP